MYLTYEGKARPVGWANLCPCCQCYANRTLNKRQEDFINNWESEAFRKKLASKKK